MTTEKNLPKKNSQSQREQFIKTARELEVDESGQRFEELLGKVAPPKIKKVIFGDLEHEKK